MKLFISHAIGEGSSFARPLVARLISQYLILYDIKLAVLKRDAAHCMAAGRKLAELSEEEWEEIKPSLSDDEVLALHALFPDETLQ